MPHKSVYLLLYILLTVVSTSSILDKYTKKSDGVYHGRYTRDVHAPELLVPRHVDNDGKFATYELPKYYNHREMNERSKRSSVSEADIIHLMLPLNGVDNHVELTPYHEFISPDMVIETHGPGSEKSLNEGLRFSRASDQQCHYRGHLRGHSNSRAALSLCNGVAGYIQTNEGRYFIEPVDDAEPAADGQHVHMAYTREAPHETGGPGGNGPKRFCGTSDNWEAAWAEQLAKRQQLLVRRAESQGANSSTSIGASKRAESKPSSGTHSIHRYVELGVICDRKFLDFHKDTDYEKYLMTIMNMVADYWHDGSCGNQVDIILVRVIYLEAEKKEIDLNISPQGEKTLASFADWAEKMNPKDLDHPNHYDIAVLITRYDICAETSGCDLMGLAYVAAACDPAKAACINEDDGLVLGIVVAHEVGHVMGCSHDIETDSGCPPQDEDKSYFLMSPIVSIQTIRWSTCSRKFITSYLESGLGDCLNNNPRNPPEKYKFPNILPGVVYDSDAQCNFIQPAATHCEMGKDDACTYLWCKNSTGSCFSKGTPPVEGTKCAEKKWCIKGKCVEMGSRPAATPGGWGEWGPMSECSRTCGAGVKMAERECNKPVPANGGRYCSGQRKKFEICSTTPCEPAKPPFRAIQCSEYDNKPVIADKVHHKWTPYISDENDACGLYCINEANSFMKLNPVVKDGTPCKGGTRDICIAGVCRKVGCDWMVDSDAVEDICGICKGDGTGCSPVEGTYTDKGKSGYQKIVTVPKGALSISVAEMKESSNVLAIKYEKSDKYCLNGGNSEQRDGDYDCAGTVIIYSHPSQQKEQISMRGPINEGLEIQYSFYDRKNNPGVSYKYYVQTAAATSYTPKYLWDFTEWGECTAKCGGGTAISKPSCIEEKNGLVSPEFCQSIPPPDPKSRICNEKPCPSRWRVSQWSKCSACDGKTGTKHRKVYCIKPGPHPGDDDVQTDFASCRGKVPKQEESCTGTRPCKKTCSKKSRDCGENQVAPIDANERQRTLTEQRRMIDNLVDLGLARYLEKNRHQTAREISKKTLKRNVVEQFQSVLRDWLTMGNVNKEKRTCHKSPNQKATLVSGFAEQQAGVPKGQGRSEPVRKIVTIKPGSIIKDVIPPNEIVLYEVPIKADSIKANISDLAFQQGGDSIPVRIDEQKEKVFHGLEAKNKLLHKAKQNESIGN